MLLNAAEPPLQRLTWFGGAASDGAGVPAPGKSPSRCLLPGAPLAVYKRGWAGDGPVLTAGFMTGAAERGVAQPGVQQRPAGKAVLPACAALSQGYITRKCCLVRFRMRQQRPRFQGTLPISPVEAHWSILPPALMVAHLLGLVFVLEIPLLAPPYNARMS